MSEKEDEKMSICSYMDCDKNASWKATATQETIDNAVKNKDIRKEEKHLYKAGTFYYCDKHHDYMSGYAHLQWEQL